MLVVNRIRPLLLQCWQWAKDLSFFHQQSTDPYKIGSGRIATRIYIVLLVFFLGIFVIYYSVTDVSQTISIKAPSSAAHASLAERYPSLACPCRNISISYNQFIRLTPVYHQVEF